MKILIAGSTGAIGSLLLTKTLADSRFTEILAITRRPLGIKSPKLTEVLIASLEDLKETPFKKTSLKKTSLKKTQISNIDVLFCCLGSTMRNAGSRENFRKVDLEGVQILGALAERMNIKKFILISAAGANDKSSIFYNRIKGEAETDLAARQIDNIIIFRPGLLIAKRSEFRLAETLAIKAVSFLEKLTPRQFIAPIATKAEDLVEKMIEVSLEKNRQQAQSNVSIIEASQIKSRSFFESPSESKQ
jgi:uncharacterized protein YbjT (DUF2867 family)